MAKQDPLMIDLMFKSLVGQSKGLLIPRSSVRFRLNPKNSNCPGFELHRPSMKGTKVQLKIRKAIIIIIAHTHIKTTTLEEREGQEREREREQERERERERE